YPASIRLPFRYLAGLCKIRARSKSLTEQAAIRAGIPSTGTELDNRYATHRREEIGMNVTTDLAACSLDELKTLLDGGSLTVYSVARPLTADQPIERSGVLATFTFASPAFTATSDGVENPMFATNPVPASSVGTPGFARARKADGTVVADFSAGPGDREVK